MSRLPRPRPNLRTLTLEEIRALLKSDRLEPALLEALAVDDRAGVRQLYRRLRRRQVQAREEAARLRAMYCWERTFEAAGCGPVAGVDESGRGPLAGPVVAAAVILPRGKVFPELNDSKLLSAAARERIARRLRAEACAWGIGVAEVEEIERINILRASLLAMRRALEMLSTVPGWVLVDGSHVVPAYRGRQTALVGGDRTSASVAAASILAKVHRDRLMEELHARYPQYGFNRHKGYGTPDHREALARYGPCPVHRRTFLRGIQRQLDL